MNENLEKSQKNPEENEKPQIREWREIVAEIVKNVQKDHIGEGDLLKFKKESQEFSTALTPEEVKIFGEISRLIDNYGGIEYGSTKNQEKLIQEFRKLEKNIIPLNKILMEEIEQASGKHPEIETFKNQISSIVTEAKRKFKPSEKKLSGAEIKKINEQIKKINEQIEKIKDTNPVFKKLEFREAFLNYLRNKITNSINYPFKGSPRSLR